MLDLRRNAVLILLGTLSTVSAAHAQLPANGSAETWNASVLFPITFPAGTYGAGYGSAGPGQLAGMYFGPVTGGENHAALWNSGAVSPIDLHPAAYLYSTAEGADGVRQVGYGAVGSGSTMWHALLWSGTAGSVVDLNPAPSSGMTYSEAVAVSGNEQVGRGFPDPITTEHAMLWHGTAASYVDLNPTNLQNVVASIAVATDGVHQAGYGEYNFLFNNSHAMLWSGSANSAVDLNPNGYAFSQAYGVHGSQQVGRGGFDLSGADAHALLWNGTPDSVVDLNPAALGFTYSEAISTNGVNQVGRAYSDSLGYHAIAWSGTSSSAIDLQALLPAIPGIAWSTSAAGYIDPAGNIFGVANNYLVEWSPVPEPTSATLLVPLAAGFLFPRRRKNKR